MRITLLHKPSAGAGRHTRDDLIGLFEAHGHAVTYHSLDDDGWSDALGAPADCLVVAGGDGTVGTVGVRLLGRGLPLAILPLGTANNVALRLGLCRPSEAIVGGLAGAERRPLNVGVARGPWGERRFVESVGLGAFTRAMAFAKTEQGELVPDPSRRGEKLNRDLRLLRAFVRDLDTRRCTLTLDGASQEVDYLLLEVSNPGLIGPNVVLAPEADCGDGRLDVAVVGEAERERLEDYLEARLAGEDPAPPDLPVRRARAVGFSVDGVRVHVDGEVWPDEEDPPPGSGDAFEVEVGVESEALEVLVPA